MTTEIDTTVPSDWIDNVGIASLGPLWTGYSFFKSFFEQSPLPIGLSQAFPEDLLNLECNDAAARFFGRTPKEVKNRFSGDMGAPKDCILEWLKAYRESVMKGHPVSFEYISKCHGGEDLHWFFCTIYPVIDPTSNQLPVFVYIINDITEKKLIELEAYRYKKKIETIINNVDCIVWELNSLNGEFVFVNSQGEKLLGCSWSQWKEFDTFMEEHVHPEDKSMIPSFKDLSTMKRKKESVFRMIKSDGSIVYIRMTITVPDIRSSTIVGVMVDLTEQFRVAELEKKAQEMEFKMKLKSQYMAEIIHEIRTPLNGVIGMTSLALESDTDMKQEQRGFIEASLHCAESLLSIVNNILDFSKIEAGKMEVESICVNLRNVVEDSASLLELKAEEKDLDLVVYYPSTLPENIIGDPIRIQQILLNLIGNAIKFTSSGQIVISVSFERDRAKISVSDTGIGVPDDQLSSLFSSFHQTSKTHTRIYGGTGLGLSISKHLVELMGGSIGVHSEVGKGSEFWFTLPYDSSKPSQNPYDGIAIHLKKRKRVMVVETSVMYRRVLHEQLTLWNLDVVTCDNGEDAINQLVASYDSGYPLDVLLLSNQIVYNGSPLGVLISNNPKFKDLSIVLVNQISHRSQFHGEQRCAANLVKPIPLIRLYETLVGIFQENSKEISPHPIKKNVGKTTHIDPHLSFVPRILVVDDNIINLKIACTMLERQGCIVDVEDNGYSALQRVKSSNYPYDVIFMDVQMPQMDGYEATKAIRSYLAESGKTNWNQMIIIALTASVTDEKSCVQNGLQSYIIKPVRIQDFKNVLQMVSSIKLNKTCVTDGNFLLHK